MKIVIDSSVINAAFAARGLCSSVFELCLERGDVIVSEEALQKTFEHLSGSIKLPPAHCESIVSYLRSSCLVPEPNADANATPGPAPADAGNRDDLLDVADRAAADCIITHDEELLRLGRHKKAMIVTPRDFWGMCREQTAGQRNPRRRIVRTPPLPAGSEM